MSLSESALDLLHRRPGRKRLVRARRPDGKADGERPVDVLAVARAYRIKFGATPENALRDLYGSTIGLLLLEQSISQRQLETAERYATCVRRYAGLMGIPSPHPRALDLASAFKGLSCAPESDTDVINRIKGTFRDCRRALLDVGQAILVGSRVNRIVYGVVVENWPRHEIGSDDVQNLRCGLNALEKVFK
jgi:hypothetical protein